ncbi:MAG: ISNCY family transposase [Acidiferrobacteraceae bacterium]
MRAVPDKRTGKNCVYRMEDAALAAFAVFMTQSPSFLAYQRTMEQTKGQNNAQTLFGLSQIPTDNCVRTMLDPVAPPHLFPLFTQIFEALNAGGHLDLFRVSLDASRSDPGRLLIALDGTAYHSSHTIHCAQCTRIEHQNGSVSYQHTVITPVIVAPAGPSRVIPLAPEFIVPQDGHDKQDCETAAAKRWLAATAGRYRDQNVTLLGDDLYSRQPLCEAVLAEGLHFLFVCKSSSHSTLYEWVESLARSGAVTTCQITRCRGRKTETDTYRFASELPLRAGEDALCVHWLELTTTDATGETLYQNAWVTRHAIDPGNVAALAAAARARWGIENGANNTLKTKGYHFEHNFGHGKTHLSSLLATLNLLAFLLHTVQEMTNDKYQTLRAHLPTRQTFFDDIRALTRYLCFPSFTHLLDFMLKGLEIDAPDSS